MRSDHSRRQGGSIYVTSHVCFGCAKLIGNSGLSRVVVDTDKADAHRNPLASYQFLIHCGIRVQLSDLVMQARLFDATVEFVPSLGHGVTRNPPLFPGVPVRVGLMYPDGRVVYDDTPPMRVNLSSVVMSYEERVAQEMKERQDPRA